MRGKKAMIPATVRSDRDTLEKLKVMSGGNVAGYLRRLANGQVESPVNTIERALSNVETSVNRIYEYLQDIFGALDDSVPGFREAWEKRCATRRDINSSPVVEDNDDSPLDLADMDNWRKDYEHED